MVSQNNCATLCGFCGEAVDSIISMFIHLDGSGFNLEFEILSESI